MPKSAKKRKDKAADFQKAKLKLGKEKKAPSNVIDTSFKARSIALPSQSITALKDISAPTTKRKLTFKDLLLHLKHYNAGVRKDAIIGLTELFEAHWSLVEQNLAQLIQHTARIAGDEDSGVRKQLLAFFSWLLPRLSEEDLRPHAPTLLLFTCSAQTHIFPEIRIDAVRFLTILLENVPQSVVEGWSVTGSSHGQRILEGYLGNLSAGTKFGEQGGAPKATSTASVVLSPASKAAVLKSFASFIRTGLSFDHRHISPENVHAPLHAWFMEKSFRTRGAFTNFDVAINPIERSNRGKIQSRQRLWPLNDQDEDVDGPPHLHPLADHESGYNMQDLEGLVASSGIFGEGSEKEDTGIEFLCRLAQTLHPILISTSLDNAPQVFAPDSKGSEIEASMILAVAQIFSYLYGAILNDIAKAPAFIISELEMFLGYMIPYFPFTSHRSRDSKLNEKFQELNLIFCELTSLLVLHSSPELSKLKRNGSGAMKQQSKSHNALNIQVSSVSGHMTKLLRAQSTLSSQMSHPLSQGAYFVLLPSIWAIINNSSPELFVHTSDVLRATLEHALKTSSKSHTKRLSIEFVARLSLLSTEPQYQGTFQTGIDSGTKQQFENWLLHLPQTLWELGDSDLLTTEVILRFLLRISQRQSPFVHSKTIVALLSRLIPFFIISHPTRGQLPGPYSKLPLDSRSHVRRLCLDTMFTVLACGHRFGTGTSEACGALSKAVDLAVGDTNEAGYWARIRIHPSP